MPGLLALFAMVGLAVSSDEPVVSAQTDSSTEQVQIEPTEDAGEDDVAPEPTPGGSPEVTVSSGQGDVAVRFDGDGVVRARPAEGQPDKGDPEISFAPGQAGSYQIADGGELTPVPTDRSVDDLEEQGVVLAPGGDFGVVVVTPEGDSVRLQADGESGGVSAVDLNDDATPIVPNDDGLLVLDDGTTIGPLEEPAQFITIQDEAEDMPWAFIFTTIAVVAAVSAATGLYLHRKSEEAPIVMGGSPGSEIRTVPFAELMERLAADPDPTRAVRVGFDAAQAGLGGLPSRTVDETPFEWEARVSEARPEVSEPVQELCDLFARARFAPGVADEQDRKAMMDQLRIIHDQRRPNTASWTLESTGG